MLRKKYFLTFTVIIMLIFIYSFSAWAMNIQIAPRRFIFSGDRPITEEVNIFNNSDQRTRIRVRTEAPEGQPESEYLGDWIVVYPEVITLEPGQQRVVRFSLRSPEEVTDGEYRSLLYFEEIPIESEDENGTEEETGDIEIDFRLLTEIGINLYGQFGEIVHKGQLENTEIEKEGNLLLLEGDFVNNGNAHLRMEAEVRVLDRTDDNELNEDDESNKEQVMEVVKERSFNFVVHRGAEDVFSVSLQLADKLDELQEGEVEVVFTHHDQVSGEAIKITEEVFSL